MNFVSIFLTLILSLTNAEIISEVFSNSVVTLPGCCKTPEECHQWPDSLNLQTTIRNSVWFRLNPRESGFTCSTTSIQILIDGENFASATLQNNTYSISGTNENDESSQLSFSLNASLHLSTGAVKNVEFDKSSYCIKPKDAHFMEVDICLSKNHFYHKCCPVGQGFNFSYGCVDLDGNLLHRAFPPVESYQKFYPVVTYPSCSYPKVVSSAVSKLEDYTYVPTPWKIKGKNQISYYDKSSHIPDWKIVTENYCVDQLVLHESSVDREKCGEEEQDILLICENRDSKNANSESSHQLYTYLNIISLGIAMCFLAVTAIGFTLLEKQNVHKKSMLFYVLSQFLFYFFIFIVYVDNHVWKFVSPSWCQPIAVLAHFFGLSTFTWLLVINFDLWWTFRVLNPTTNIHWTRLMWYGVIATSFPILVISVALVLQHFEKHETPITCRSDREWPRFTGPGYGKELCFLSNNAQLPYFYIPVGILLLMNVIFYSCTSYRLCTLNKKNQQRHRSSCQLLLKLFFIMGTVWILQVIHALVDPTYERTWYWSIVDIGSMLQSIAIFVIFICKRENWRILTKKYPALKGMCCTQGLETIPDNTPDGSTRLSRTEGSQQRKSVTEFQQPSEIIQLPYHRPT